MKSVYLGFGSNLGRRLENLTTGLRLLAESGLMVQEVSSIYETEAVDCPVPAPFLNGVVYAQTDWSPENLLERVLHIEDRCGRRRSYPHAPRTLDIDLLIMEDLVLRTSRLEVPHPRLTERRFVLVPLAEIAPHLRHPISQRRVSQLLAECTDLHTVKFYCKWTGHSV